MFPTVSNTCASSTSKSLQLKKSLSKTLTQFYPFAGRIDSGKDSIDCNDCGVPFLDAFAPCSLMDMLGQQPEQSKLVPSMNMKFKDMLANCPLIVQVTSFQCDGMAIAISTSHKIADASTIITFIASWATCGSDHPSMTTPSVVPDFSAALTLFPPIDKLKEPLPAFKPVLEPCVTKRFVFDGSKISQLIIEAKSAAVPQPTRVQAVTALLWKCAMRSSDSKEAECVLRQAVNVRKWLDPPLHDHTMGNLIGALQKQIRGDQRKVDLGGLVALLRKGLVEFVEKLEGNEAALTILESKRSVYKLIQDGINLYSFSSWCKFPFYEVDFGWGKPCWFCPLVFQVKNVILLVNAKDGRGIEAWVTLKENDMAVFQKDDELLSFGKEEG